MNKYTNKIIVILGPTSSGKSDIAIKLARKFNGEIISADSRQVYRGMNIGTGKVTGFFRSVIPSGVLTSDVRTESRDLVFISENIPHYMIDIVSPRTNFSAANFKKKTDKIIADILKREKLPIICGGTGFWIKAVVDNISYPEVKPDWELRKKLGNKSAEELFSMLLKLDPERAENIDAKNKVRLIRAIEICEVLGKVPSPKSYKLKARSYEFLQIGLDVPKEKLHKKIKKRLNKRWKQGMIEEVKKLHFENKISWKRIESFGLGYSLIPKYLRKEITSEEELFEKVYQAEKNYAKRQMTWFQKDKRIKWLENYKKIYKEVVIFLKK